jgi:hypothetical protein
MYLDRIQRRIAHFEELGCIAAEDIYPCTAAEVEALEAKLGLRLPAVVRELYLWCGKGLGDLLGGTFMVDYEWQMAEDLRGVGRRILAEAGEDPAMLDAHTLIVQTDADFNFAYLRTDEGNDPPVHCHTEQEPIFCGCERFSDYLEWVIEEAVGVERFFCVRSAEELNSLPVADHEVVRLAFAGGLQFQSVPDRVFDFKDLKSLSLCGKRLMDVSARVAELAFLSRLDLSRNNLSSLPMAMSSLDALEDLDLSDNQLRTVIDVLRALPSLRWCSLRFNPLADSELNQLQSALPHVDFA